MAAFSIIQKSQLEGAMRLDAEYYQPEYLGFEKRMKSEISQYKLWKGIKGKFITGPFGSEFHVENYESNGRFRYIRGKDVKEFFLTDNDNVYIPKKDFDRLKKYALCENDILISVVGTLGNVAIVEKSNMPSIFSCKSTAFRTDEIDSYYFLAYLNSKYGRGFLERSVRGAVQTGLNIDDLKNLPIYVPATEKQNIIGKIIKDAQYELKNSKDLYKKAEELLLKELGLESFDIEENLSTIVNFSDILEARRMDAEYFQEKYEKLILKIKNKNAKKLGGIVSMKKGFEPGSEEYQEEGKLFVRVSSLSKNGIESNDQKYLSDELYNKLEKDYEPKVGEILLTKDATPGIAYFIKEKVEGIISGGILRLKLKEDVEGEYLALCLNSIVGKMQAERDAGGSIIAHWKPEQIKNILIPILPKETQRKISDLVRQSHEARKYAKELLEEAKRKVENMIEKGGEKI